MGRHFVDWELSIVECRRREVPESFAHNKIREGILILGRRSASQDFSEKVERAPRIPQKGSGSSIPNRNERYGLRK